MGRSAPNKSGVHFLSSGRVVGRLVRAAGLRAGDLVMDFGAGTGALTGPLAGTGARVLAVERDAAFVRRLERRFADRPSVRVVHGDVRSVPLPRRSYSVVASIPFAVSTVLLRRLLGPARGGGPGGFRGADLIVEWGLAARVAAGVPRDAEAAWWSARYDLDLRSRVAAGCFSPAPAVDAAHLSIRPAGLDGAAERALWAVLRAGFAAPGRPAADLLGSWLPRRRAHRVMVASGIDPPAPVRTIDATGWRRLATTLATDAGPRWPALPRHLGHP